MLLTSKGKQSLKSSSKLSQSQQPSSKANQQITTRMNKSSTKNNSSQKARSPQMIKLMINQLQKQLMSKTISKNMHQTTDSQLNRTRRKLTKNKSTQLNMKHTVPSNKEWKSCKSPNKKKHNKNQQRENLSLLLSKTLPVEKSLTKVRKFTQSQLNQQPQTKATTKTSQQSKKEIVKKHKNTKQNYIFLNNDFVKFSNFQHPLFIMQNTSHLIDKSSYHMLDKSSHFMDKSQQFSYRNDSNKSTIIDQRQYFMRHSKVPSLDSVNSNRHVNYIQRSFCQDVSDEDTEANIELFQLNLFGKKYNTIQRKEEGCNSRANNQSIEISKFQQTRFDFNQLIELNRSVSKIQVWWRNQLKLKNTIKYLQQPSIKQSLQTIQTKEQSQKQIEPIIQPLKQHTQQKSLSQKQISYSNTNDHNDILKLRQNAAYIQFSTHQQILKQLLDKNNITHTQFHLQLEAITLNLSNELSDIEKIRTILKESAQKVQSIMKKTKNDILTIKGIVFKQGENSNVTNQLLYDQQITQQQQANTKSDNILSTIFGKNEKNHKSQKIELQTQNQQIHPKTQGTKISKQYKRINIPTFQTELQQFINQTSQSQDNSFLSNQNTKTFTKNTNISTKNSKTFNSPTTNSQQSITSPYAYDNSNQEISSQQQQNLQEELFACQIESSPQSANQSTQLPFTTPANFQQLYKQYQEQQQTKKQLQSRISKQLGLPQPQCLKLQKQNQVTITTSIVAIHKFLLNFFKFYLYYHKNEFLTHMNMPFGQSIETRLTKNKLKDSQSALQQWTKTTFYTDDDEEIIYGLKNVIPQSVLKDFFDSYYEQTDIQFTQVQKTNIQLEKIHNRAVFQAFNQALNFFRPYYNIGGAPYLWCSSQKSLTFFCIGQDNIQQVYEKTQIKILKTSSHLCGVIIDVPHKNNITIEKQQQQCLEIQSPFKVMQNQPSSQQENVKKANNFQEFFQIYTNNFSAAYLINLEQRLKKKQVAETEQQNMEWFVNTFQQGKVSTLLNLTQLIEEIILLQQCSILQNIRAQRTQDGFKIIDEQTY